MKKIIGVRFKKLGKIYFFNPEKLYINWASAMQIQFHVNELNQNYNGDKKNWAKEYLYHFTQEATKRSKYMINEYVIPYEKYTKSVV